MLPTIQDLLPLTIRQYCYGEDGTAPDWWLPCYDLSTEFHLFAEEHHRRSSNNTTTTDHCLPNRWIIKPAQGTRGMGHNIVSDPTTRGLQQVAAFAPMISDDKLLRLAKTTSSQTLFDTLHVDLILSYDQTDRVAQLLVEQPLLIRNRKFDLRYFVLVRSFYPFEGTVILFVCQYC